MSVGCVETCWISVGGAREDCCWSTGIAEGMGQTMDIVSFRERNRAG